MSNRPSLKDKIETVVLDKDGNVIDRFDGLVTVEAKNYDQILPVTVVQYEHSILNVMHIDPKGGNQ